MKKSHLIILILSLILVLLSVVKSIVSNGMSTSGAILGTSNDELKKLQTENVILREKLFALSSLTVISSKAARMGFTEEKKTFSLAKTVPIAAK